MILQICFLLLKKTGSFFVMPSHQISYFAAIIAENKENFNKDTDI